MELFPKFKERGAKDIEMVEGMKKSVVSLCEQMKDKFDTGAYDAIVSDDTGGRIPTLLLSDIYKRVSKKKFPTLFVATGNGYRPRNEKEEEVLSSYIQKGIGSSRKVLLVTQYLRKGETTNHLIEYLKKNGVEEVEIATLEESRSVFEGSDADAVYVGGTLDLRQSNFAENHNILSGITKNREYSPAPLRLDSALETWDESRLSLMTFEEFNEFAGIGPRDSFEERRRKEDAAVPQLNELNATSLSSDERKEIQENINRTRETIKKLASEIVEEVWQKA